MTLTEQSPRPGLCQSRSGLSLPRAYRLSRKEEFDLVLKSSEWRVSLGALRAYVRGNTLAHGRLGVIVGRRFSPRAVDRNHLKRLVRESFRLQADRLLAMDVVIQLISSPTGNESTDLVALLERLAIDASTR